MSDTISYLRGLERGISGAVSRGLGLDRALERGLATRISDKQRVSGHTKIGAAIETGDLEGLVQARAVVRDHKLAGDLCVPRGRYNRHR